MAASGFTPISLYYSTTPSATPTAGNLVNGELAINIADGLLFYKDSGGVVRSFAGGNVNGPASSTDNAFARYDSTTGKLIQNSAATLDDTGSPTFVSTINVSGTSADSADIRLFEDTDNGTNYLSLKAAAALASNVTLTFPATAGSANQALTTDGSGNLSWTTIASGTGDVVGPSSSTDNAIARFDGTTGKLIQNSAVTIDDTTGSMTFTGVATGTRFRADMSATADADRFAFQSSITNGSTNLQVIPNGTSTSSLVKVTNSSNLSNNSNLQAFAQSSTVGLSAGKDGTGSFLPLTFLTNGSERIRIDTSGRVGIGTNSPTSGYLLDVAGGVKFGGAIDETVFAVSGTTPALSPSNGTIQTWTLSGNSTPTAGTWNEGESMTIMINDGTAFTITWTSVPVTWVGGSAPTLATSGFTVIEFWKVGTTVYGALVGSVA